MAQHNETGHEGEEEAVKLLVKKGYSILEQNWRFKRNELDIIARKDDLIVFIEVKTRTSDYLGSPAEAVTPGKQKTLVKTAHEYLVENDIMLESRFDIIAIIQNQNGTQIEHLEDAFGARW